MNNIILIILSLIILFFVCSCNTIETKEHFFGFFKKSNDVIFTPEDLKIDNNNIIQSFNNNIPLTSNEIPITTNEINNMSDITNEINDISIQSNDIPISIDEINTTSNNILLENSCKFLDSEKCSSEYPIYTGASLGSYGDNNLLCESVEPENIFKPAKLIASISNGSINSIYIVDGGNGYNNIPNLIVKGDGEDGELKAELTDGKITKVNIINSGINYKNTPSIYIDNPVNNLKKCYLCCKLK